MLCIKCAMTVHIKYRIGESPFDPASNLNCPNFVIMNENTFIHAISIELETRKTGFNPRGTPIPTPKIDDFRLEIEDSIFETRKTIAEEIIADFEEYETETAQDPVEPRQSSTNPRKRTIFQKVESPSSSKADKKTKENLYEFSEDNEKCEKISTFRKRCLADKKYEFSEETLDNILPFNRIRNRVRSRISQPIIQQPLDMHLHRSPNQGFRSPCGSPVGYRFLRSPPGFHSPNYYYQQRSPSCILSPRQIRKVYTAPIDTLRRISSPTHRGFFDTENNENRNSSNNLELKIDRIEEPWKVSCSKKVTRYFVEEDDANSVVTTEEDDCISPGYHTSLPLEVHGACYSNMQPVSQASYLQLKHCAGVLTTQNTLDTEALTVHAATHVCSENNKVYDMLSDSTYTVVHVCPVTWTIICVMRIEFFANDSNDESGRKVNRRKYSIAPLFTWNIQDCTLNVITYGKLQLLKSNQKTPKIEKWMHKIRQNQISISSHLRVHTVDITKTKDRLTDMTNMIEFYRGSNPSDFSSDESSDDFSDSEDNGRQTASSS